MVKILPSPTQMVVLVGGVSLNQPQNEIQHQLTRSYLEFAEIGNSTDLCTRMQQILCDEMKKD